MHQLIPVVIAQAEATPPPPPADGQAPAAEPPGGSFLIPMLIVFFIFYFLIIRPSSKQRKQREAAVRGVKKGDAVVMSAGMKGIVKKVDEHEVTVQIDRDKDIRVQFLKGAILEVLPDSTGEVSDATQRELADRASR